MTPAPSPRPRRRGVAALAVVLSLATVACGGDDGGDASPDPSLSAAAEAGRRLARVEGCAACHGGDGDGGVGPTWIGLAGSTVTLEDGSTVTADEAYLTRAITDPDAEIVEGYTLRMPENDLDDDEVAELVAYITALGGEGSTSPAGTDS